MTLDAETAVNQVQVVQIVPSTSTIPTPSHHGDSSSAEHKIVNMILPSNCKTSTSTAAEMSSTLRFVPITAAFSSCSTVLTTTSCSTSSISNMNCNQQPVFVQIGPRNLLNQQETMMFVPLPGTSSSQSSGNNQRPLMLVPVCPSLSGAPSTVDARSLQNDMSRNREALRLKLQLRPPKRQLVQQGILPARSVVNPAIHESVRRLQRAQMGDALKRKIEQRPDKHKLITQHILLSDSSADPLIQEKVEQLKKCKLADNLNNKLAHRPGPLELIDKHILHVDVALEDAIKDGRLQFKPTSAGLSRAPFVEIITATAVGADSAPSSPRIARMEVISTPSFVSGTPPLSRLTPKSTKMKKKSQHRSGTPYDNSNSAASKGKVIKFHEYKGPPPKSLQQIAAQATVPSMIPQKPALNRSSSLSNVPLRAVDISSADADQHNDSDSSYDLLLHQQQLFLQWQLELRQHNLELVPVDGGSGSSTTSGVQEPSPSSSSTSFSSGPSPQSYPGSPACPPLAPTTAVVYAAESPAPPPVVVATESHSNGAKTHCCSCPEHSHDDHRTQTASTNANQQSTTTIKSPLADWRVNDLKQECKKRQLPVSGPKPQLLERLRPFEDAILAASAFQRSISEQAGGANGTVVSTPDATDAAEGGDRSVPLPPIRDVIHDYLQQNSHSVAEGMSTVNTANHAAGSNYGPFLQPPTPGSSGEFSSDASRVPSNYSSPGIDLTSLSFAQAALPLPVNANNPEATFSFASQGSGGQFTLAHSHGSHQPSPAPVMHHDQLQRQPQQYQQQQQQLPPPQAMQQSQQPTVQQCQQPQRALVYDQQTPQMQRPQSIDLSGQQNLMEQMPLAQSGQMNDGCKPAQHELHGLLSATTLSIHEEMLRHQQRKIEELQRELQRSQDQLKHQQQVILAAKKAQANGKPGDEGSQSVAEVWLAQLDTKHLQKFHIQLFLQHKLQQQQMQQQLGGQQELAATQQKLQEELHVQQAVQDIVRLIRQDARTALLMVQLLRRFQLERSQSQQQATAANGQLKEPTANGNPQARTPDSASKDNCASCSSCGSTLKTDSAKKPAEGKSPSKTKKKPISTTAVSAIKSVPSSPAKSKTLTGGTTPSGAVDMEAIFKTVLEDATKALTTEPECAQSSSSPVGGENRLPSCDQLMPPYRTHDDQQNGQQGFDAQYGVCSQQSENATSNQYQYSKSEAFDDLMDVLRGDENQQPCPVIVQTTTVNGYAYPNTYGSQELADLLGQDWLQDPDQQQFLTSGATPAYQQSEPDAVTAMMTPTSVAAATTAAGGTQAEDAFQPTTSDASVADLRMVDHELDQNMDWLDLMLPSLPSPGVYGGEQSQLVEEVAQMVYATYRPPPTHNPVLGQSTTDATTASHSMDAFA